MSCTLHATICILRMDMIDIFATKHLSTRATNQTTKSTSFYIQSIDFLTANALCVHCSVHGTLPYARLVIIV